MSKRKKTYLHSPPAPRPAKRRRKNKDSDGTASKSSTTDRSSSSSPDQKFTCCECNKPGKYLFFSHLPRHDNFTIRYLILSYFFQITCVNATLVQIGITSNAIKMLPNSQQRKSVYFALLNLKKRKP